VAIAVVAVPIGLSAVGEGIPLRLPGFRVVQNVLGQPLTDSLLLRGVAVLCWLIWALFVAALVIEIITQLSSKARRLRGMRIPGLQGAANTLVMSALLLVPQRAFAASGPASGSGAPRAAVVSVAVPRPAPHPHIGPPVSVARERTSRATGTFRYVVERYDSPWRIAERYLGDGTRWREIIDGHLRPLGSGTPPGDTPGAVSKPPLPVIRPGDVLFIPGDGLSLDPTPKHRHASSPSHGPEALDSSRGAPTGPLPPSANALPRTTRGARRSEEPVRAQPADTTAPRQATDLATPAARPTAAAGANGDSTPWLPGPGPGTGSGPGTGVSPSVDPPPAQLPGPRATSPGFAAGATFPPSSPNLPTSPGRHRAGAAASVSSRHAGRPLSTTLVEAGLLSAGVLGTLDALRRRQARHRPAGRRIRLPGQELTPTERALRIGEEHRRVEVIDRAMHELLADLQSTGMAAPSVMAVVAGSTSLEVLLDRPLPPPPPWTGSGEGFRWRIGSNQVATAEPVGTAPLPALVPIGRAGDDEADVLLNLEAAGVLCVTGEAERAAGVVRALATCISGLSWAHAVNLVLVGFGSELEPVERVRSVSSIGAVIDELRSIASLMGEVIGGTDPFLSRVTGRANDGWAPTVVCCPTPMDPAEHAQLMALARPGMGVVAVLAGPTQRAAWTIDVDTVPMIVQPLRLAVAPSVLDAADLDRIGKLYRIAQDESGAESDEAPYAALEVSADRSPDPIARRTASLDTCSSDEGSPAAEPPLSPSTADPVWTVSPPGAVAATPTQPPPVVLVRVLGTVEIDGAIPFKRAKSRELAVYLALHPNGVGESELDEALWPSDGGRVVAPSTRDSTVSVARTALGGPSRLLPAQGHGREKRYQLSGAVGTDWALFCNLHRTGRANQDTVVLCSALDLVRGRPFEGVIAARTYGWVHTEGHARHIEAELADAADLAGTLLLRAGRAVEARWAARRGLLADPYVERLWVRLMEAADQLGDSQEIERILDEMDVVLDLDGDFTGLHPSTLSAYRRLSRRHRLVT
jgi:DNA-binding SARP family transcriptional activator/nucleoid-associated protein YgaU